MWCVERGGRGDEDHRDEEETHRASWCVTAHGAATCNVACAGIPHKRRVDDEEDGDDVIQNKTVFHAFAIREVSVECEQTLPPIGMLSY